ncbi:hypothetical protein BV898_11782 [Hypsibius exemplaris]|uniref:Uncharacterized protein n=1 Tax=Hypsibius exemplaris TaxID=2072580 RepID=A0A1W0WFP3_HYPEX|nr:hypothetical protein BV898_11782 [Hypsibius exemplaris]
MWLEWIVGILACLTAYYTWIAHRNYEYWKKKGISGPRPLPLLGVFVQTICLGVGPFDISAIKKYGRKFGYFEGGKPVLSVSDPD